jgi:transcriptional regulator with GAF, ATPase, and Fis domain
LKIPVLPELEYSAIDRLMNYHWPGNVRELENLVERELILSKGKPLVFSVLAGSDSIGKFYASGKPDTSSLTLDQINAQHIRNVLKSINGVVHGPGGAAAILGINPSTLRSRMKKMGIPFGRNK